jgi:hypothetical protein
MKYKFLKKYIEAKYHSLYRDWSYIDLISFFKIKEETNG